MENRAKLATGAGLLAIIAAALGYSGYERFKPSQDSVSLPLSTIQPSQPVVSTGAPGDVAPLNTNQSPTASTPAGLPYNNPPQTNVQLNAPRGGYAPVPASIGSGNNYQSSVSSTREYSKDVQTQATGAPAIEQTTTTTSVKTSYVPPSTAVHQAYIHHRVRYEKPGNVHVGRAVKHTLGFTANLPKRLRF